MRLGGGMPFPEVMKSPEIARAAPWLAPVLLPGLPPVLPPGLPLRCSRWPGDGETAPRKVDFCRRDVSKFVKCVYGRAHLRRGAQTPAP